MPRLSVDELHDLATRALALAGANPDMAAATARALVYADARGLASHGVARVAQYATHLKNGRADGTARPKVGVGERRRGADRRRVRARLSGVRARRRTRRSGAHAISAWRSRRSPTAITSAWPRYHLEAVGAAGLVGLAFGNSPAAMPAAGGKRAIFGTNPIAAIFPRPHARAARGRPVVVGGGARQADGGGEGGQEDSARLGARQGRPADHRSEGRPRRKHARDGRDQGRHAGARRGAAGHRAHRSGDRLRGRHRSSSTRAIARVWGRPSSSSIRRRSPGARPTTNASKH